MAGSNKNERIEPMHIRNALSTQLARTLSMFQGHNRSIKAILASEILFGMALGWFSLYRPVYMVALGLTKPQVGLVSAAVLCSQVFGATLGGIFANRIGNKRSMQLFDAVAWLSSIIVWMTATNFWSFIVAGLLNGLFFGAIPNWNAIIAGNTPRERRPAVYGLVHLFFLGAGFFSPIAGFIVARYGVVAGNRVIYGIGFIVVSAALLVRQLYVGETSEVEVSTKSQAPHGVIDNGPAGAFRFIRSDVRVLAVLLCFTLGSFCWIIWASYSSIYMTDSAVGLGIPPAHISMLPALNSLAMAVILLFVMPNVKERSHSKVLVIGPCITASAIALFMLAPRGVFWPVAVASFLYAGGGALYDPLRSSLQANLISLRMMASVLSLGSTFTLLVSIPVGPVSGQMFVINPRLPFILMLGLQVAVISLVRFIVTRPHRVSAGINETAHITAPE